MAKKKKSASGSLAKAAGAMGEVGGPARAKVLSPAKRSAIAREGGIARQKGKTPKKGKK